MLSIKMICFSPLDTTISERYIFSITIEKNAFGRSKRLNVLSTYIDDSRVNKPFIDPHRNMEYGGAMRVITTINIVL